MIIEGIGNLVDYLGRQLGELTKRDLERERSLVEEAVNEEKVIGQIVEGVKVMKGRNCNYDIYWENALNEYKLGSEDCKNPEVIRQMLDPGFLYNLSQNRRFFEVIGTNYSKGLNPALIRAGAAYASYKKVA